MPIDFAEYMGLHVGFCEGVTQHGSSGAHSVVVASMAIHSGLAKPCSVCLGARAIPTSEDSGRGTRGVWQRPARIPNLRHHTGSRPAPTRAMAS
jgi:hypothetical protein